jgi:hypothetical protein
MSIYLITAAAIAGIVLPGARVAWGEPSPPAPKASAPQEAAHYYFAPGVRDEAGLTRLQETLRRVPGVSQVQAKQGEGGALLRVLGPAKLDALHAAAREAGFELRPAHLFEVRGVKTPEDQEKLRQALATIKGIGELQFRQTPRGLMLEIRGGTAGAEAAAAAAKAAGFELRIVEMPRGPGSSGLEGERNTPAARGERILQDLTKVGDPAPDFTLITRDGKGKISLSDYRGKKPVVLLFGSYT